jgi:putative transposase
MFRFIGLGLGTLVRLLHARRSLLLEYLALRQQLAVLKRRHPRPRLDLLDKVFWVSIRRFWRGWQQSLIAVAPDTVVRWHRGGFRLYWRLICKARRLWYAKILSGFHLTEMWHLFVRLPYAGKL